MALQFVDDVMDEVLPIVVIIKGEGDVVENPVGGVLDLGGGTLGGLDGDPGLCCHLHQ